tara:strand:- start:10 stop:972 length:963 start_codon:yes stop_codon:yes gene_type:complete
MSERPILLVDGLNLFIRHFVVNPTMSDLGHHIGGTVGFLKSLHHLSDRVGPSKIIVLWEGGGSSRRRAIFKEYKQGRRPQKLNRYYEDDIPDTIENRDDQVALTISLLKNTPVQQIYVPDCEADDVIGYIVKHKIRDRRVVIVSSDKDLYQLLSKNVVQWSPGQKKFITLKDVKEKFGVSVVNFCTARAFSGDKSDGLPGAPGVGFASLSKRFTDLRDDEFVSVDDILAQAKKLVEKSEIKIYTSIIENHSIAKRNWKLMFLDMMNLSASQIKKIDFSFENFQPSVNKIKLIKSLTQNGVKNFDVDSFFIALKANIRRNE